MVKVYSVDTEVHFPVYFAHAEHACAFVTDFIVAHGKNPVGKVNIESEDFPVGEHVNTERMSKDAVQEFADECIAEGKTDK